MNISDLNEATIAAIATPPGPGGIGIIRVSGRLSLQILKLLFRSRSNSSNKSNSDGNLSSHRMYYGKILDPATLITIDEVLVVYMKAPHTYTKEDVVEIQCHGSYQVLQKILGLIFAAGARPATQGEFTKRAFLNGRIDLTQAEAVLELIEARTAEGAQMAAAQLQGRLHQKIIAIRDELVSIRAVLEVAIDFPEDDVDILHHDILTEKLQKNAMQPLIELITAADQGKLFREGISAVILGKPNVGKSSLLNTLLNEERALVTPVPGTTRDTIEEFITIKGMAVRVIDTAGIRETNEIVEELGIQRAKAKVHKADLILLMLDASESLTPSDFQLLETIQKKQTKGQLLLIVNKTDLPRKINIDEVKLSTAYPPIEISAKTRAGINKLTNFIFEMMTDNKDYWDPGEYGAPNLRHKNSLLKTKEACSRVLEGLQQDLTPDLLAIDLQTGLNCLGDIVGTTTTDDVLDMIFDQFCIGK